MEADKLYKKDAKGKTRVWWVEYDDEKYRTHSGINQGKIVTSGWIYPTEKNVGKANETSISEQTKLEVDALYVNQTNQGGYHSTIDDIEKGASYFKPMLASKFKDRKDKISYPVLIQPKLDGVRCIATKDGLFSREGKQFVSVPHIEEHLKQFFDVNPDHILDGELYNHELKNDFEKIISLVRKTKPTEEDIKQSSELVQYHIYDMFNPTEKDIPFCKRSFNLYHQFENGVFWFPIMFVQTNVTNDEDSVRNWSASFIEQGYEGSMVRTYDGKYDNKRSNNLIKFKEFEDAEFEIVEIIEGNGNWANLAKAVAIRSKDGIQQKAGMRGSFDFAKEILSQKDQLVGTLVTVQYQNLTSDGLMRFPIVTKFWRTKVRDS